jgi:hypothetical protein
MESKEEDECNGAGTVDDVHTMVKAGLPPYKKTL